MKRLMWIVLHSRFGVPGIVAVGVMLASLALQFAWILPMETRVEQARATGGDRAQARALIHREMARHADPAQQIEVFYQFFASASSPTDVLEKLYRIAAKHSLALPKGQYRLLRGTDSRVERYQIVLPVRGSYPTIRAFLAQTLNEIETVSLETVRFEREKIGDSDINAEIRLTLFLLGKA